MLNLIMLVVYITIVAICLLFIAGLALILWDDVNAERRYRNKE